MMKIASLVVMGMMSLHASADIDQQYNDCVKTSRNDNESAKCLDKFAAVMDKSLVDTVHQLLGVLNSKEADKPKAKLLEEAHAKWIPSRDADCKLQAAVTMEDPAEQADAAKLCAYQANVPRLRQYERFLGFVK